jgi:large subunit ribosomal protein L3
MMGLMGKKVGMTQLFNETGDVIPVTVVQAGPCQVTQIKSEKKEGYNALQLTLGKKKREVWISKPEEYQIGQEIKTDIFKVGDIVKVSGKSVGKGFQGNVKRFHAHRGPMSHGSKSHRLVGSISSGTTPGRVRPGKKMPGRMGGGNVSLKKTLIVRIDADKNLIFIKGSVPGKNGNLVLIRKD